MAFTRHTHYIGPNYEIYGVTAVLGADVDYELEHTLGRVPLAIFFTGHNAEAAAAGYYVDEETTLKVDIHKAAGQPGAHIHVHLSMLGHPH